MRKKQFSFFQKYAILKETQPVLFWALSEAALPTVRQKEVFQLVCDIYDKQLVEDSGYFPVVQSYYYNEWKTFTMRQHMHSRIEIMYIIKGDATVHCRQEDIRLFSGDFILLNAGTPHSLEIDNPRGCLVLNIEFLFEKQESAAPDFATLYKNSPEVRAFVAQDCEYFRIKDNGEVYRILFSALENVDMTRPNRFSLDLWTSLLLLSIARLSGAVKAGEPSDYIQAAKAYISRYYYRELHVNEIAEYIHLHPAYLQRLFKKECDISVVDYLTQFRMEKAYYLLSRTNMSIMDIANSVGISSQQYFTRLFKKITGITPKALRDSNASDNPTVDPINHVIDWTWRPGLTEDEIVVEEDWNTKLPAGGKDYHKPKDDSVQGK